MALKAPSIQEAWTRLPGAGPIAGDAARFTSRRMERIIAISVAIGSGTAVTQGAIAALNRLGDLSLGGMILAVVVLGLCAVMVVSCVIDRGIQWTTASFAICYPVALVIWPFAARNVDYPGDAHPWPFFLVTVSVGAALLSLPVRLQLVWVGVTPLLYLAARLVQGEFAPGLWTFAGFDVSFMLILGLIVVSLAWMCRAVAAGVDEARAHAVASSTAAAAEVAADEERIAIAALMHDSVLAALIAAERAHDERTRNLAVGMSREALTRLADVDTVMQEGNDEPVSARQIVAELRRVLSEWGADAVVEQRGVTPDAVPGRAARALVLASRQAIGNSIEHARGRGLHVVLAGIDGGAGITVTVQDTGPGFDVEAMAEDRLGIRASIFARMAGVAGTARVDSDGAGTSVVLGWHR